MWKICGRIYSRRYSTCGERMRLLHTSDWHLGQTLHGFERSFEQQCFLDWLLATLEAQAVDALLIAGDIFDNPNPSAEAQRQFYQFLSHAKHRCPQLNIVSIAGNHDSAARLEAPHSLLRNMGISIVGSVRTANGKLDWQRLVLPLYQGDGSIGAWCLALPFLRPGDVPAAASDAEDYAQGVRALYQQALEYAQQRRTPQQAVIALGHCHIRGGQVSSDSERRIVIGGAEALPLDIFHSDISYVALGHLHRAQRVAQQEQIRYAGSPFPMSFSEINYQHQVLCVELQRGALQEVRALHPPRRVEMLRIPPQPAALEEVLEQLSALQLADAPLEAQPYLQVRVRQSVPNPLLRRQVEAALEHKPVRLVRIEVSAARDTVTTATHTPQNDDVGRWQPADIFQRLYQERYQTAPSAAVLAAFAQLVTEAQEL